MNDFDARMLAPILSLLCFAIATAEDGKKAENGQSGKIKVRAEVGWYDGPYFHEQKKACVPLLVNIIATGELAAFANEYQALKIEAIEDDRGETREPLDRVYFDEYWREVPRHYGTTRNDRGMVLDFRVFPPDPPIQRIRRLKGSFQIHAGKPKSVIVQRVKQLKDTPVDDPALKKFGLKAVVNPPGKGTGISVDGVELPVDVRVAVTGKSAKLRSISSVAVTDAGGNTLVTNSQMRSGFLHDDPQVDSTYQYLFDITDPLPDDALLYIVYLEDAREMTVPFELRDIDVPPAPPRDPTLDNLTLEEYLERSYGASEASDGAGHKAPDKNDRPRNGLEGYCPVTLVNEQRWVLGSYDHRVEFEDCTYFFTDADRKQKFQRSPDKYVPAVAGFDPVIWLEEGKRVAGRRRHGIFYKHRIVLFANEKTLSRFSADATRFWKQIEAKPTQADGGK